MNLFNTKMTALDDTRVTTCEKKKVAWNKDLTFNKGKIISAETRANMSAASKGRPKSPEHRANISAVHKNKGTGTKPLMTPNGLYPSRKAVAEAANVPFWTVDSWIKKWPQHYFYLD